MNGQCEHCADPKNMKLAAIQREDRVELELSCSECGRTMEKSVGYKEFAVWHGFVLTRKEASRAGYTP